ncbi:purine-cytosine permease family protein [Mariniflexile sp.]|uniref:purine-cytosine permease family protein n=1 Tax=Mariniflexile sp. TaxID=1979402 RepID=UPI004047A65B
MQLTKWLNLEEAKNVNEYEREPVPKSAIKSFKEFVGLVAGEHIAGTEFVIGPLFVVHGVAASDLFLGLLLGNILATLSWALVCAPTAVKTRLTIFYQLEKICGFNLVSIYNFINGLLFSVAAAAMIGVSASAVGILFGVKGPGLTSLYPESFSWVLIIAVVGSVIAIVATFGFDIVAKFSLLFAPWMPLIFLAAGLAVLPQLGVTGIGDFWEIANEKIWTGIPLEGQTKYTFWNVVIFAWLANNAMHIGLSDMSIYRYAKKPWYGFASAFGMFIGHYMAWIASGILIALALSQGNSNPSPGEIAFLGAGIAGLICVVAAGWTTANPTIYRGGLAIQALFPKMKRWKITVIIGIAATVMAGFPIIVSKLDQFLGLYALVAAPVGAVVLVDIYLFPKIGLVSNLAEVAKLKFNISVALTWGIAMATAYGLYNYFDSDFYFFMALPGWITAGIVYIILAYIQQKVFIKNLKSTEI